MKVEVVLTRMQETTVVLDLDDRHSEAYREAIGSYERARVIEEAVDMGAADHADWVEEDLTVQSTREVGG